MLTDNLHDAMERATEAPPFAPRYSETIARYRRLRTRQRLLAATSVVAVLGLVAGITAVATRSTAGSTSVPLPAGPTVGLGGRPVPVTPAELIAAYRSWGPTRGNLATDTDFQAQVLAAWAKPEAADLGGWSFNGPRALTGTPRVLYAGTTPDGVAAVVDQPSQDPHVRLYIGVLIGADPGHLRLVAAEDDDALVYPDPSGPDAASTSWYQGNLLGGFQDIFADPNVLAFADNEAATNAVILPVDPTDSVEVSTHAVISNESLTRTFTPVATSGSVAVAPLAAASPTGALVRVVHRGRPVDESPVLTDPAGSYPKPSNLLSWFAPINVALKGRVDGGGGSTTNAPYQWVRSVYGTPGKSFPAEPFEARLLVNGNLPRFHTVQVVQEWLPGNLAQTVVLLEDIGLNGGPTRVVSTAVTRSNAHPLVATRLPGGFGWIVLAGHDATVQAYRDDPGAAWRTTAPGRDDILRPTQKQGSPTREAVLLRTHSRSVQIRLRVHGQTKLVTATS